MTFNLLKHHAKLLLNMTEYQISPVLKNFEQYALFEFGLAKFHLRLIILTEI